MDKARRAVFALSMIVCGAVPAAAAEDGEAAVSEKSWLDRASFFGKLRLRHEQIDEAGNPDADVDRERGMVRAGLKFSVIEDVRIILGVATGGDNPVSRNVTGDGGFTSKEIGFELMYVDWQATDTVNVYGGKMKNPLFRAGDVPLIWDSDLNPEGVAVSYEGDLFFGNVGGFSVEDRSGADDSYLYAAQAGVAFEPGENIEVTAGVGYFMYTNTIGNTPFYDGDPQGNTVDIEGNYAFDYRNAEAFAELGTKLAGWPVKVFGHYTRNTEVDRQDTAYALGATLGSSSKRGAMEFSLVYQDIEADAVIGTFNDSDFGGGGADSDGFIVSGVYMLADSIGIGATVFFNEIERFQGTAHDFDRVQLDLEFEFE